MKMPILQPLIIPTQKARSFGKKIKVWLSNRRWRLVEDYHYNTQWQGQDITIIIPKDFMFDGASIPRCLHWLVSPVGVLLIPGLIHDFCYRYDYLWVSDQQRVVEQKYKLAGKKHGDELFKHIGNEVNGMRIINAVATTMLLLAGHRAWNKYRKCNTPVPELLPQVYRPPSKE